MATSRYRVANRRNAGESTGPKSAEGKARSFANARRYGLSMGNTIATETEVVLAGTLVDFPVSLGSFSPLVLHVTQRATH